MTIRKYVRSSYNDWLKTSLLLGITCCIFYPFVSLLIASVKDMDQFIRSPWTITIPLHFENYIGAWLAVRSYVLNSFIASGCSVIGVLILSAFTGYVFARYKFAGREILYLLILGLLMIPGVLTLVPSFMLIKDLGLRNTRLALIIPYISGGQVFGIFLLRSFFASLPEELFESARIDGGSDWQIFTRVGVPLCKAILGTLAIINVLGTWNDLIWPLVTLSDPKLWTIPLGLMGFRTQYYTVWGVLFSGYLIAAVPLLIVFVFTSKLFVEGLTAGALKM